MATRKGPKHKHILATLVTGEKAPCAFCQRNVDDEITYGKLYAIGDIQCHYFCVLLSCCLIQKGKDEEGLFGFLYADILAEIERSKKHRCSYCLKEGATLGCSVGQCRKQFHLPCGRQKDAVSLFYGNYKSFCQLHAPKQKIPDHIMVQARLRMRQAKNLKNATTLNSPKELCMENQSDEAVKQEPESVCVICYEEVEGYPTLHTFWPTCCARDAWFHRTCVQRMALSAGMHYLKCPLCNDKETFYEAVVSQGYYVPDRDAAWELEQDAFAEIYERRAACAADQCLCPSGRGHDADAGEWELKLCILCGTEGAHAQCLARAGAGARLVCAACRPAAPSDLERLARTIENVILSEQAAGAPSARRGPVMPSRMSLRRTKRRLAHHAPSTSKTVSTAIADQPEAVVTEKAITPDTETSRLDLNLKTPKRPKNPGYPKLFAPTVLKDIENVLLSPLKLLEQGLNEKIQRMGVREIELDSSKVLERVRERFKKPRPLSEKKRIINDILESLFDNMSKETSKNKEPIKEWSTPKKCSGFNMEVDEELMQENIEPIQDNIKPELPDLDITKDTKTSVVPVEITTESSKTELESQEVNIESFVTKLEPETAEGTSLNDLEKPGNIETLTNTEEHNTDFDNKEETCDKGVKIEDDSSNSTFELPPEFVADHISDDSLSLFETPKKLTTVDIQKDSSLEISASNEIVNVDIFKMDVDANAEDTIGTLKIKTPVKSKNCAFKFNPLDKDIETIDLDIDMESFKNQYLNEVDREFKCTYDHRHKHNDSVHNPKKIRTAIDFALEAYKKEQSEIHKANNLNRKSKTTDAVPKRTEGSGDTKHKKKFSETKLLVSKGESQNEVKETIEEKVKAARKRRKLKKLKKIPMRVIDLTLNATGNKRKKLKNEIDLTLDTTQLRDSGKKRKKTKKNKRAIQVKIRWKKEQLRLKITESQSKKKKKENNPLKQYVLKYSPETRSSDAVLAKPDSDVVLKRKYVKQEKSADNLKQTSIQSFFRKVPEKLCPE